MLLPWSAQMLSLLEGAQGETLLPLLQVCALQTAFLAPISSQAISTSPSPPPSFPLPPNTHSPLLTTGHTFLPLLQVCALQSNSPCPLSSQPTSTCPSPHPPYPYTYTLLPSPQERPCCPSYRFVPCKATALVTLSSQPLAIPPISTPFTSKHTLSSRHHRRDPVAPLTGLCLAKQQPLPHQAHNQFLPALLPTPFIPKHTLSAPHHSRDPVAPLTGLCLAKQQPLPP